MGNMVVTKKSAPSEMRNLFIVLVVVCAIAVAIATPVGKFGFCPEINI